MTGTAWALLDSLGPPVRNLAGVAHDSRRNVIVLHGGTASQDLNYGDTWEWEWDGTTWTRAATSQPPPPRTSRDVLTPTGPANTMLVLDQNVWQSVNVSGPSPRYLPGVAFDGRRGVLVLFGGGDTGGMALYSDSWEYDGPAGETGGNSAPHSSLSGAATGWRPSQSAVSALDPQAMACLAFGTSREKPWQDDLTPGSHEVR